jgi:two-component SAPR family response regulator
MDAEGDRTGDWHELGRVLVGRGIGLARSSSTAVEIREFGGLALTVNGEQAHTRIRKSLEMLAFMAAGQRDSVLRDELREELFDGRQDASTRSYLRQAIHHLRAALPDDVGLDAQGDRVRIAALGSISSESIRFEELIARAHAQEGDTRLELLETALAILDQGSYLPGVRSPWAEERRNQLSRLADDTRVDVGELLFRRGRYPEAQHIVDIALLDQPYSERAWRLKISLADIVGDDHGALDAFRRCQTHLSELGVRPSSTTVELIERLRA